MGTNYVKKNPPGKKRGPKPEYFESEEVRKSMAERGMRGVRSEARIATLEANRVKKMKRFLKNFEKHHAMPYYASKASKMGYATYQLYRKEYKWFDDACREIEESVSDFVEGKLIELIDGAYEQKIDVKGNIHTVKLAPNEKAVEFFLNNKGKSRGYGKGFGLPEGGIQIVLTPATPKTEDVQVKIESKDE